MGNNNYLEDSEKFWENYKKAREKQDKKLASLSFSEKVAITERLQTDYEALQNAKGKPKQFGLGELPPEASNVLSLDPSFTKGVFEGATTMVFPLSQALPGNEGGEMTAEEELREL